MIFLTPTVCGYWLKIEGIPRMFYASRANAIRFVETYWFPILPPELTP